MCQGDRIWHVLFGLVGRVAEHHTLITGSDIVGIRLRALRFKFVFRIHAAGIGYIYIRSSLLLCRDINAHGDIA